MSSVAVRNLVLGLGLASLLGAALWYTQIRTTDDPSPPVSALERPESEDPRAAPAPGTARLELPGETPYWPDDWTGFESCDAVEQRLERACSRIAVDCEALREAVEVLAASPPRVEAELRSYETMLANVFHLFRVLGRDRISLARRAVGQPLEELEPAVLAAYRWSLHRSRCEGEALDDRLYDYASFLFGTLGGQAYLRRRSPAVEGLACFYGLDVIERAIEREHNPYGIDPRPELERCRALVGASRLALRDRYLARLDEIAREWERRGT